MIFRLNYSSGQPLYLQLMQQVRHAVETGVLVDGDPLPGIRTLAEELVVSHNTVAKAYSELQHEGLLTLRHGAGAFIRSGRRARSRAERLRVATERVRTLVSDMREDGLTGEEIFRVFEAECLYGADSNSREREHA